MPTIRSLKLAAGAGDPDGALALRIDVVRAAEAWSDALNDPDNLGDDNPDAYLERLDRAEVRLDVAVKRYRAACAKRSGAPLV